MDRGEQRAIKQQTKRNRNTHAACRTITVKQLYKGLQG